jgi:DNA-directed RNA polymerase subunit RPC12/RpoP
MNQYINPATKVIFSAMRRGGPMDTTKLWFVCQKCGKHISLTLRQAHKGAKPVCTTCGPGAQIVSAKRVGEDSDSQA